MEEQEQEHEQPTPSWVERQFDREKEYTNNHMLLNAVLLLALGFVVGLAVGIHLEYLHLIKP